jgi:histone H1/5
MSAPVATPVAAPAAPKPVKKVVKKPAASAGSANKATFIEMIADALKKLNEKSGSSRQAILKYIVSNYPVDAKAANQHVKLALKNGVKNGQLKQSKGVGASGSFKLGDGIKNKEKIAKKKAAAAAKPKKVKAVKPKVIVEFY